MYSVIDNVLSFQFTYIRYCFLGGTGAYILMKALIEQIYNDYFNKFAFHN